MLFQSALFQIQWTESQTGKIRSVMTFEVGHIKTVLLHHQYSPYPTKFINLPSSSTRL